MSVRGGLKAAAADRVASWPRRISANVAQGFALLARTRRARQRPSWRAPARIAAGMLVALVAIAGTMVFVDARAIIAARRAPHWVFAVFDAVTDFGKAGWFLWPIGILLAAIAALASPALPRVTRLVLARMTIRLGFLFAAIAVPSLFTTVVKRLVGRARPFVDSQVDPFHYMPFVWRPDYAGMPSGHATTAFAAAIAVGVIWPRLRAPMWAYALIIAASRVVLTAHYPSDVVAGAVVGIFGAWLVRDWFAARRLGLVVGPDGGIRTFPGPSLARIKRVARSLLAP